MLWKIKQLLFIFLLVSANAAYGQIYSKSVLVGGALSGDFYNGTITGRGNNPDRKYSLTEISFTPKAGLFLTPSIAVGLSAEAIYYVYDEDGGYDSTSTYLLGGPFVRYYFANHIFVEASGAYGVNTLHESNKVNVIRAAAGAGYAFFINENVAVEPMLRYVYDTRKLPKDVKDTRGGVQFMVGLQVYLYRNPRSILTR